MKVISLDSMQILDSRGNPTLRVEIVLDDGSKGVFDVPSGASTGIHEAVELRDKDNNIYQGKSVYKAVENVKLLKDVLLGKDFNQESLDKALIQYDGTENKGRIGANSIIGVSVAFAKAAAKYYNIPTYDYVYRLANNLKLTNGKPVTPGKVFLCANVINGGLHSGNDLNMQEFMIVPVFGSVSEKIRAISETYHILKTLIAKKYGSSSTSVGDEGGFAPEISKASEALDLIVEAIKQAGYENRIFIAMDSASSDFYDSKTQLYEVEKGKKLDYKDLTKFYNDLISKYPIIMLEDPMSEDDFKGFAYFMKHLTSSSFLNPVTNQNKIFVVGDDLLVTNPKRVKLAVEKKLCDGLLLKVNQIGTLSEALESHRLAKEAGWQTVVSHRSGETDDDFIADLTTALSSSIKLGSPARGERIAKYNRFLEIYKNLN